MSTRPWSFVFHYPVTPIASLNPDEVKIAYDSGTDTLFGDLWSLRGPTISCWVSRYEYLRIEIASRQPVGTQIEALTRAAAAQKNRYLEIAAMCDDLFRPTETGSPLVSSRQKLAVVHRAVILGTSAYDRRHGIYSSRVQRPGWIERQLQEATDEKTNVVAQDTQELQPAPPDDRVLDEFSNMLSLIAQRPQREREREFNRVLQYWSSQPSGALKATTGKLLLTFVRKNQLDYYSYLGARGQKEELLLRSIMAG